MTPAELRALLAKATPGPWKAETDWFDCANEGIEAHVVSPTADACFASFPIDGTKFGRNDPEIDPWTDEDEAKKHAAQEKAKASQELADAKLIAAAVNALPALLDVFDAAEAIVDHDNRAATGGELKPYEGNLLRNDLRAALNRAVSGSK